ncbi:tyrosine-protein phosphatase non-receptor type 9-like [Microplitis mediator]|uniref:tyrosine-protein phosphatase non-receptor type 9-like n=1 Tax=Microplitis mediator TaxID=375433 RepID=UPI0025552AD3|nr:tyrosine-protein phosphatase non-receptor type 9-like [Microplitis mediator]
MEFKPVDVKSLWKRVNQPNFSSLVWKEYFFITNRQEPHTWKAFAILENSDKNRSSYIPCWDKTRVKLSQNNRVPSSYIHANYVGGFEDKKKFICTQGPMAHTVKYFWRTVWINNCRIIIVLISSTDNNKDNYYQYWNLRESGQVQTRRCKIKTLKIMEFFNYIMTVLDLTDELTGTSRNVYHFLYTKWPENDFPDVKEFYMFVVQVNQVLINIRQIVSFSHQTPPGPVVMHCSTGIGRTGTFCAMDNALSKLVETKQVSLPQFVTEIRQQRH